MIKKAAACLLNLTRQRKRERKRKKSTFFMQIVNILSCSVVSCHCAGQCVCESVCFLCVCVCAVCVCFPSSCLPASCAKRCASSCCSCLSHSSCHYSSCSFSSCRLHQRGRDTPTQHTEQGTHVVYVMPDKMRNARIKPASARVFCFFFVAPRFVCLFLLCLCVSRSVCVCVGVSAFGQQVKRQISFKSNAVADASAYAAPAEAALPAWFLL